MGIRNISGIRIVKRGTGTGGIKATNMTPREKLYAAFNSLDLYNPHWDVSREEFPAVALDAPEEILLQETLLKLRRSMESVDPKADSWRLTYVGKKPFPPALFNCHLNWAGEDRIQLVVYLNNLPNDASEDAEQNEVELCLDELPNGHYAVRISQEELQPFALRSFIQLLKYIMEEPKDFLMNPY